MTKYIEAVITDIKYEHPTNKHWKHCETGPAIITDKNINLYFLNNYEVDKKVVMDPASITVEEIDNEFNQEVKSIMIRRLGLAEYFKKCNPEIVHKDLDEKGKERILFKKTMSGFEEPILMIKLVNSSPEADGSFKPYFLQVHHELKPIIDPGIKETDTPEIIAEKQQIAKEKTEAGKAQELTCHNAVASLVGLYGEEYGLPGQKRQGDVFIWMKSGKSAKDPFMES